MENTVNAEECRNRLIGACIGLARTCESREDQMTIYTNSLLQAGFSAVKTSAENVSFMQALIEDMHREKFRISPDCYTCQAPCGKTSDFVVKQFSEKEIQVLDDVCQLAELLQSKGKAGLEEPKGNLLLRKAALWLGLELDSETLDLLIQEFQEYFQ